MYIYQFFPFFLPSSTCSTYSNNNHVKVMNSFIYLSFLFYVSKLSNTFTTTNNIPFQTTSLAAGKLNVITTRHGVVASDDGRCSTIGKNILIKGGNAIDASVATALCLGIVSPASSGIGGGAFMLLRLANGTIRAFDMTGTAPMLATQDMYAKKPESKERGPLSITVPGQLAGLYAVWKQYGKLPWKMLVSPAEILARQGFNMSFGLYAEMLIAESEIKSDMGLREIFAPNGRLLNPGEICRSKKLAKTLREIGEYGVGIFYNGSIGVNLVRDIQKAGGILKIEDLQHYQVKIREPISSNIMGLKLVTMPPTSSGGASMLMILNILAQYGFSTDVSRHLQIHREIEAVKHTFAMRAKLGDPDFVDVKKVLSDMLSPDFAYQVRKKISDEKTFGHKHYGPEWNVINDHGTSHLSVVDCERNVVALTNSIRDYFGARFLSQSTGIIFNNYMDDFSIPINTFTHQPWPPPAPSNFIRPFKRPVSSMTPTVILKDKEFKGVLGGTGGPTIIAGIIQVFLNHFVKGLDPLFSVTAPKYYHKLIPNVVACENWTSIFGDHFEVSARTTAALRTRQHKVISGHTNGSSCQLVVRELDGQKRGTLVAATDPRNGGRPDGY